MHGSNEHPNDQPGEPENEDAPAENWFRFGDEPDDAEEPSGSVEPAAKPEAERPREEPAAASEFESESESEPEPEPAFAASTDEPASASEAVSASPPTNPADDEADGERFQPFVVSATPGGVDPELEEAADAAVVTAVDGGSRGFGLVGILTVVLIAFGVGLFMLTGPDSATAGASSASVEGPTWLTDVDEAMARSAAEGKPMLIHFTADWCPPCRTMRDSVFSRSSVRQRLASDFITVRVDLTERGGPNDLVAQRFEVRSIPNIQVYHAEGWQMQRVGYMQSASEFLGKLDSASR